MKYHFVYKITNSFNGKYYIGVHSTSNIEDGYMGSGIALKEAIKKYGVCFFEREILFCFESRKEAFDKEKELVNIEAVRDNNCYNISLGGQWCRGNEGRYYKPIYSKKANPFIIQSENRFDSEIKYLFVPNIKEVNEWSRQVRERYVKAPCSEKSEFNFMLERMSVNAFPDILAAICKMFNNVHTNKNAIKVIGWMKVKGLLDCFTVQKVRWEN